MAPLSLRIVQDGGAVTRKMKLEPSITVAEATKLVEEKANLPPEAKAYGLFLRSVESDLSGIWLENDKKLSDYLLRDGDQLDFMSKIRKLRLRMLDDTVKTFQVDQSKLVSDLMLSICSKIGITNHEEYGMCFDDAAAEAEEGKEKAAGHSGTLTLKKKSRLEERDLEFEQLSKKLKTDDNVNWIDSHKTLSEAGVAPEQTVLLKRRLFYSDRNVDSRDPVQLNLLYNQARDNVLAARHPVTEEQAAEFAGIQCQIQFGDYHEEKHKPGFIENLREYLPEQYCSSWSIEKKILKAYSKHAGLNELEAKHVYTKTARALPTYGVTFFLVKEKQKGKKKLVPRLLGINAESILRLDETTKEIIQTWPLTHVKTYHAGKGETFTLNFGDYSDKEYSVKTRDAFRIRDILEGYIDLIRKRMLANYNISTSEHGYIGQENISCGQANTMQHIANNPNRIVEHSVVGPSKILDHVPGQRVSCVGTQVVTAQQMVIAEMKNKQEKGILQADVSTRQQDMGIPFTRRLNRLNSNSVKISTLLADPSQAHIEDAHKIASEMDADMPTIREGVAKTIAKQTSEEEKKKLQDQLNQLNELMKNLTQYTNPDTSDQAEAKDAAEQIASLSTEMYFAIAPGPRRRSSLLLSTRRSFIEDEKTEQNLRRASFIAAAATTNHALDSAIELVEEEYKGLGLSPQEIKDLEQSALDKLGKINAAIAHYLLAHSDPKKIDYSAAVNSLNTIHELMPDLAREGQVLASVKDGADRTALVDDIKELCATAKHLCSLSGVEDPQKLQEASSKYADVSGRLVYVFGRRGGKARADKENQIIDLTEQVVEKTAELLKSAQGVAQLSPADPAARQVCDAAASTASAANRLQTQTALNAPTITEPHCQSALTAACESLSSSAQLLAASWKPLVEHPSRHHHGERLHHQSMELARALDSLKEAFAGDRQDTDTDSVRKDAVKAEDKEAQRLKFINSLSKVGGKWRIFEEDLDKPLTSSVKGPDAALAQRRLADRLAQLNAAVATLLAATSDRENTDYKTAEAAAAVIDDLMPEIVKDSKLASANQDEASRADLLANIKQLCAASKKVCASAYGEEPKELNDSLIEFTDASDKLTYVVNSRSNPDRQHQIIDATSAACAQAGALLANVQQVTETIQGESGQELDTKGATVADVATTLFTIAQVTAPSISDPRCQSTLLTAVDKLASTTDTLEDAWTALPQDQITKDQVRGLGDSRKRLDQLLEQLRALCQVPDDDMQSTQQRQISFISEESQEQEKLQFVATMRGAKEKLEDARKELDTPAMPAKGADVEAVQHRLERGLEDLNAAIASLLAATADRENPDCVTAQKATENITKLMPQLIRDTKTVSSSKDEVGRAAMLSEIRALCDASDKLCAGAYGDDTTDRNEAVTQFSDASGKLVFVANPRKRAQKTNEVTDLARSACKETSDVLPKVQMLAEVVGGARGRELDEQGGRLASNAQALLQAAQILGPSLQSPQCQEALLSSISNLSDTSKQLESSIVPLKDDTKLGAKAKDTLLGLQKLQKALDELKTACKAPVSGTQDIEEQQKLQFIKTLEDTKGKWADVEKELKKPVLPSRGSDMSATEERLCSRLAALDAAIASLITNTADKDKPSYAEAEKSVKDITDLLPLIVQDTKTVSSSKNDEGRAAMLSEIRALCDASDKLCAGAYGDDAKERNKAISQFADASGKLVFVANPRKKAQKTNEVTDLARSACKETSDVLPKVQMLAEVVGGARGRELDEQGGRLASNAQALLQAAQILGPSLQSPQCQEALLSSISNLSDARKQLESSVAPLKDDPKHGPKAREAVLGLQKLEKALEGLRATCKAPGSQDAHELQKQQFFKTLEDTKSKWADVEKELKKPVPPSRGDVAPIEERLSTRLAALDSAIASLLTSTTDKDKPSFVEAEKSVKTISELLPQIVHDTKTVSSSKDDVGRAAMLSEIRALCDASDKLCAGAYGDDASALDQAVSKYSEASAKLMCVANPRRETQKGKEVLDEVQRACAAAAGLLSEVQQLSQGAPAEPARALDEHGGRLADAAQNLLHIAQITSSSLSSPDSRSALVGSIDKMSEVASQLSRSLDAQDSAHAQKLSAALKQLLQQLDGMKRVCEAPVTDPPAPSKKPPPLPASKPPVAHAAPKGPHTKYTEEFLDRLRTEEGMAISTPTSQSPTAASIVGLHKAGPPRSCETDDEKIQCPMFTKSLEDAAKSIKTHQANIMKQCRLPSSAGPALCHREMLQKQALLQHNLALAPVHVANLLDANYVRSDEKVDYSAGIQSSKALPEVMNSIVEDGTVIADNLNDMARKAFLYDMLQLCEAARRTCEAGLSDRQKLNDAAVNFGDTATKLLYVVSKDVDPALEKEIISRAKAIGEDASRLALDAANVATAASGAASDGAAHSVQDICDAGTGCVDAAGKLVYTAKLTAPSIREPACQDALVTSADRLADKLKRFAESWAPLHADPKQAKSIEKLSNEADTLKSLVSALRSGVKEGTLSEKMELQHMMVEDSPMRQLTCKILEEARHHAESPTLPAQEKIAYASYVDKISDALRALDLANARCKKSPHDTEKRRHLEKAIQSLQMILLQTRPSRGDKGKTNIVDLMDFMEEVATEAKNLSSAASTAKVPAPQDMLALEEIKDKCDTIHSKANKLISGDVASDLDFNDLFDQFGQECEDTIKKLSSDVNRMEDNKTKRLLQSKVMALSESCNMLRFATKSGISTEACCNLDATLDEQDDIEERVINNMVREIAGTGAKRVKNTSPPSHSPARLKLCRAVTSRGGALDGATVTAYIADAASRSDGSPEDNNKLLKHLYKLVHLLKTLTVRSSARAATWQHAEGPETARLTEQILQEISNPESQFGVKPEDNKQKILEDDIAKLLISSAPKILGDKKLQEDKLTHLASQLSATCNSLSAGVSRDTPADATRNLSHLSRVAADHAVELDGIARGVYITDPVQRRRIDEGAKEMSFATYNLLKTAETACLDPKNTNLQRRLAVALENLNNSIDKLVWLSSTSPALSRACGALSRGTAAQLAALAPRATTTAPFNQTCDTLLQQHQHIAKLKSDEPVLRKEFMRDLDDIGSAVRSSVDCAAHCAYYIAVSDTNKDIAKTGLVDVPQIQKSLESIQDSCMAIIGSSQIDQAKEQKEDLHKRVVDFSTALDQAQMLVKGGDAKRTLLRARSCVGDAAGDLETRLEKTKDMNEVTPKAVELLNAVNSAYGLVEKCPLVPTIEDVSKETKDKCDEIMNHSKSLLSKTLALLKDVQNKAGGAGADDENEMMTWVTFNTNRKKLLEAYDALVKTVRRNGHRAGIYEKAPEDEEKEQTKKSYIEIQVDLANKWLKSPACKAEAKTIGQQAARNVVDMARQMSEDLKGPEREEVRGVISETDELLAECVKKYDHEKNSLLMDRLKELRKCIQRGVVTRVVEDFIEAEAPLADLDVLADVEQDESKRKFILERKIASLLAQLGRVTKTVRFVSNASQNQNVNLELTQCSEQAELLAPMLVKAAQQRIDHPDDKTVIEKYKSLLAQYAESISKVRDLCDRAVDPMDFVQTAGETMQRMREDMTQQTNDAQKCARAASSITKLANRVINVGMSSNAVAADPELLKALKEAKQRLTVVTPPGAAPHWQDTTAEILRTTGDVESALGGENIFKKGPTTANQPIYDVARSLHESVREWSSRDNEIVGVARRMAVLMARLSEYMETDKKDALIATSKSIVSESEEVTELAKKLAHECTDVRIKTNLLQTCDRIPTISGQLKMLTAVKAASLGQQAVEEDKEAMDMLVGNAQSLMMSISDVVKAAASASVKIMSQRGPRLRWVRKTYY